MPTYVFVSALYLKGTRLRYFNNLIGTSVPRAKPMFFWLCVFLFFVCNYNNIKSCLAIWSFSGFNNLQKSISFVFIYVVWNLNSVNVDNVIWVELLYWLHKLYSLSLNRFLLHVNGKVTNQTLLAVRVRDLFELQWQLLFLLSIKEASYVDAEKSLSLTIPALFLKSI